MGLGLVPARAHLVRVRVRVRATARARARRAGGLLPELTIVLIEVTHANPNPNQLTIVLIEVTHAALSEAALLRPSARAASSSACQGEGWG